MSLALSDVAAFNLALLAAWAVPGPAMIVALRATLGGGRAAGFGAGGGLALVAALWTLLALAGLDALFHIAPWAYVTLKVAGALYLLVLAVRTWRHAGAPVAEARAPTAHAFLTGVMVNLGNPKSVMFAAAVLIVIFPPNLGWGAKMLIALNHLALELLLYGFLVVVVGAEPVATRYLRARVWLDRAMAGILGALGLRLLAERG